MTDGIIKGNGASRYLKTIPSGLSQYPTYEDFMQALVEGTFPIDLFGRNPGGWTQEGTLLNKASLLPDAVAEWYGLDKTAEPAQMWDAVSVPPGAVFWLASEKIPFGYLLCDGAAVSRTDYAKLFHAIGTVFGTGDGSTTFQIPNLRAKFIRGAGTYSNGIHSAVFGETQNSTFIRTGAGSWGTSLAVDIPMINPDGSYNTYSDGHVASPEVKSVAIHARAIRPVNIVLTPVIKY